MKTSQAEIYNLISLDEQQTQKQALQAKGFILYLAIFVANT